MRAGLSQNTETFQRLRRQVGSCRGLDHKLDYPWILETL